ncbi:phage integrase SAM-like domain-containing protein [Bacteroides sp.]|uniref:tyrosine-type recombinase/integrase n=1 Tax=Bacteroides sp. TaxID=29523 RepID=UPI0025BC8E25|nr:phage integrase SAM-like domain-containing protein [Bacteroides sp.]
MAILKLCTVPAKVLTNGKHKIRISLAHNSKTRYIPTECIIDDLSQFKDGQVTNHSEAASMNVKLRNLLNHYQKVIDGIYDVEIYSCSELREIIIKKKDYVNVRFSYVMNEYLSELFEEKRTKSEKLYRLACQSFIKSQGDILLSMITPRNIRQFEIHLEDKGLSPTTIKIYLTLLKVIINYAKKHNMVRYEVDPFEFIRMPSANIRELDLTIDELKAIRDMEIPKYNIGVVRDIFMLSYYLGGINLIDMLDIDFRKSWVEYYRRKTKNKKQGESKTAFSVQPEAREIIEKYMQKNGKLVFGKYKTFGQCYSVVSRKMDELARLAGINKRVVYYSARKSFVQHGFELGISLEILEYCIGQSMKTNRPIFNYFRVMRKHADEAIRKILDNLK